MTTQFKYIYSYAQTWRFSAAVEMLAYDHGSDYPGYEYELHGSGVYITYKETLFFICTKHSFHGDSVANAKMEDYDSLCFFRGHNLLAKPKWTRIQPCIENKESAHVPEEDILIYEISPEQWGEYGYRRFIAATISPNEAIKALEYHQLLAFFCGFPNQYNGNLDYDNHVAHQELKGRYVKLDEKQKDLKFLSGSVDVDGFVDQPKTRGEFNLEGMSGGGLFTCNYAGFPLFLGMCLSGTVQSKRVHFLSVFWIKEILDNWLSHKIQNS